MTPAPPPFAPPADTASRQFALVCALVRTARALAQAGRILDLAGLDQEVGRLCAFALDSPPGCTPAVRPLLAATLAELDALAADLSCCQDPRT